MSAILELLQSAAALAVKVSWLTLSCCALLTFATLPIALVVGNTFTAYGSVTARSNKHRMYMCMDSTLFGYSRLFTLLSFACTSVLPLLRTRMNMADACTPRRETVMNVVMSSATELSRSSAMFVPGAALLSSLLPQPAQRQTGGDGATQQREDPGHEAGSSVARAALAAKLRRKNQQQSEHKQLQQS